MYRDVFRDGMMLSQGHPDRCLRVHTASEFNRLADEFAGDSPLSRRGRHLRRAFSAGAREVQLDNQNRILIPPPLRQFAGLQKQVLVVGTWDCLEIWEPTRWEEESERILSTLDSTMEAASDRAARQ